MSENMKKLLEALSENAELKGKFDRLNEEVKDLEENMKCLVALAAEVGITLTDEDFEDAQKAKNEEMDEEELNAVAGGRISFEKGCDCFCFMGGGGVADEYQKTCACVFYGLGEFTNEGLQAVKDKKIKQYKYQEGKLYAIVCCGLGDFS